MSASLKIKDVKSGKKNGIDIERFTFSDDKVAYRRVDKGSLFPKDLSKEYVVLISEYVSRRDNEDEVARIMSERGYSTKRKNSNGGRVKKLILATLVLAVVMGSALYFWFKRDEVPKEEKDSIASIENNIDTSELVKANEQSNTTDSQEKTEIKSNNYAVSSDMNQNKNDNQTDQNVYEDHRDSDGTIHYTDRSAFDPHACDKEKEAYQAAYDGQSKAQDLYDISYKSQRSYLELYREYGKQQADEIVQKQRENVQIALDIVKEHQALTIELYEKWSECRKTKMYGL